MPTSKKRLNLSLPKELEELLTKLARRDKVPVARKVLELIQLAIETEEDAVWVQLASERDTPDAEYISHDEFWRK